MRPPISIVIACGVMAAICASLGWIGITEQQLTTGGKLGISTSYGLSAVVRGWFFIAAALGFVGILASRSRFRNLIWLGLSALYFLFLAIFYYPAYLPWL